MTKRKTVVDRYQGGVIWDRGGAQWHWEKTATSHSECGELLNLSNTLAGLHSPGEKVIWLEHEEALQW
ncbi:hypothetical protein GCM10009714_09380 [Microlunatus capsulatus]